MISIEIKDTEMGTTPRPWLTMEWKSGSLWIRHADKTGMGITENRRGYVDPVPSWILLVLPLKAVSHLLEYLIRPVTCPSRNPECTLNTEY